MIKSTRRLKNGICGVMCLLLSMGGLIPAVVGGSPSSAAVIQANSTPCVDPVPNPLTAGWTQEGGGSFQVGARLLVVDPGLGANDYKTFRCADVAIFQGDVVLTPRLTLDSTFIPAADGNLGVHVTINDGANQFRVVLFREGAGSVRVKVLLPGDVFSPGFGFFGLGADFSMSRLTNGSMVLSVANPTLGGPPLQEIFNPGDVPQTTLNNLEFGTYNVAASSKTNWETLGLPEAPPMLIVPVNGVPPTLTPVTINNGAGDQNDPHISGDLVAYASDFSIRYYSFATNTDAEIPRGLSLRDLLSDVSGTKIVFSRVISNVKSAVMVFDTATPAAPPVEIDPAPGTTRLGSAIGGNTVAYIDFGLEGNGELIIHDLLTATSVRVTNDTNTDQSPSVSPDGNVVTWEHCLSSAGNCDIWQAVKSGAVWNVSVVSNTVNSEANPDTNGTLVVYDSRRPTNGDIFWHPVNGGAEVQLLLPGFEANPSIAGNLIAFEGRPTQAGFTDIFVYDITTNLLYQITDTPLVNEQLNDITVLPDVVRVVWASDEDGPTERNIKSATFSLSGAVDNTPPVITPHADITANATSPSGAVVSFTVQATDDVGIASLICVPPSGSVFPVGTTLVQCTASDDAGNTAVASFNVMVKGASEQIVDLVELVRGMTLPPLAKAKLLLALQTALANPRNKPLACTALSAFIALVQSQPASVIPPAKKAQLIADATRIKAVIGCS